MGQQRMTDLPLVCIERGLLDSISIAPIESEDTEALMDINKIISDFANLKTRKKYSFDFCVMSSNGQMWPLSYSGNCYRRQTRLCS